MTENQGQPMRIYVRVQEALVSGWKERDQERLVFMICREDFERVLGRECKVGEVVKCVGVLREVP